MFHCYRDLPFTVHVVIINKGKPSGEHQSIKDHCCIQEARITSFIRFQCFSLNVMLFVSMH